ncbi:Atrial natriuretic peptide receptor 1 [Hypsibius exemplaris]|uniref:Guanylate cyclase n=1 Tax=Hypsibius exemplaris TaxID=2072580 RepID=A0A1W0WAM9_HYPEX|nr:Atrial natriuretic peptide receptor 1 [Hypsibius exemplaris]
MMYAQEVASMVGSGYDRIGGTDIINRILGREYGGLAGPMRIGRDGERDNDLEFRTINVKTGEFESAIEYIQLNFTEGLYVFRSVKNLTWPSAHGKLPPDEPVCGFRGERCFEERISSGVLALTISIPLLAVIGLGVAAIVVFLRLRKLRQDFDPNWWRIGMEELSIMQNRAGSSISKPTTISQSTAGHSMYICDILATYKGNLVALTDVASFKRQVNLELIHKLNMIKACSSPNMQKLIGISLTGSGHCEFIVNELCGKGSLADILENEMIKLDWNFKNNLIRDIVFGMSYLHSTAISSHGNLTSHTCLIDARFTLKIADYGLPLFRNPSDLFPPRATDAADRIYHDLLWRAPELLRQFMPPEGTQKGDVYSFAILLQQIILRSGPFDLPADQLALTDREILQEVITFTIPPVRPRVPRSACSNELYNLMERCWEEVPVERPTFAKIKEGLKKIIGNVGDNIVDLLLKRMEQYATDLEMKVAEKTQQFMEEKSRSEELLNQLLPKQVAAALTKGEHVEPEAFESVSIFFSDIVGFTTISAAGSPMDVISMLNGLYTFFDSVLERFDVYKVETIGDAYMVSSGLPERNGHRHAVEIAQMSLDLLKGIALFAVPNRPDVSLEIRAGINSGPCVAGVVGLKMPRYCLFGDTVNVASRMESTGERNRSVISRSDSLYLLFDKTLYLLFGKTLYLLFDKTLYLLVGKTLYLLFDKTLYLLFDKTLYLLFDKTLYLLVGKTLYLLVGKTLYLLVGKMLYLLFGKTLYLLFGKTLYLLFDKTLYLLVGKMLYLLVGKMLYLLFGKTLYLLVGKMLYLLVGKTLYLLVGKMLYLLFGKTLYLLVGKTLYLLFDKTLYLLVDKTLYLLFGKTLYLLVGKMLYQWRSGWSVPVVGGDFFPKSTPANGMRITLQQSRTKNAPRKKTAAKI